MSREDEGLALTTRTSGDELSQVLSMIELGLMDLEDSVWKCGCGTGDLTRREGSLGRVAVLEPSRITK